MVEFEIVSTSMLVSRWHESPEICHWNRWKAFPFTLLIHKRWYLFAYSGRGISKKCLKIVIIFFQHKKKFWLLHLWKTTVMLPGLVIGPGIWDPHILAEIGLSLSSNTLIAIEIGGKWKIDVCLFFSLQSQNAPPGQSRARNHLISRGQSRQKWGGLLHHRDFQSPPGKSFIFPQDSLLALLHCRMIMHV